jgi:hypothetical protein
VSNPRQLAIELVDAWDAFLAQPPFPEPGPHATSDELREWGDGEERRAAARTRLVSAVQDALDYRGGKARKQERT